jgi:hypothetical protein
MIKGFIEDGQGCLVEWGQGARGGEHRNETLEYRDKRTLEPRKWKIGQNLHSVKRKP